MVKDVNTDADGSVHVRYNRTFGGLRVIGGDLVSHRDRSGSSKGVSWNGPQQVAVPSTSPKTSLASARALGRGKALTVQKGTSTSTTELVVFSGDPSGEAKPRLAYDVLTRGVRADQTPSRLHTIVDANTARTLTSFDEIVNGTGRGIHVGRVGIGTTAGPLWSMRDSVGNHTTDLNGRGDGTGMDLPVTPGTIFTDADNVWGNGLVSDRASAGVAAHYGAERTFDYFKLVQGRAGIRNNGVGSRSRVHYGNGYVNAFWDGAQMTYGDGAGNTNPVVEIDVAAHEITHGVTEHTAGLLDVGEAGGLSEATSDIFGTSVEWYANNAADTPDYLIGELININGNGTPLRYMDRPSRDGFAPDCWSSTLGGLDSHDSAGPLNHWFYLASEGSGAKVINGVSYNSPTCNASRVTPIGRAKAAKIWYRTLTRYLTSTSTYAAAREGAIQSAKDLYGAASPECVGIAASFSAIGVPRGAKVCASTPTIPVAASTRLSDLNRDGLTDLVARDRGGLLWLYPGNGAGGFLSRRLAGKGWNTMTAIVTPGDITGDGNGDVLGRDAAGGLWLYPGNGAGGLSARRKIGSGWGSFTVTGAADLNGAGRPDLLARDSAGGLWLYPFSGNAVFGARTRIGQGWKGYTILGPGDVTGDGRADILARNIRGELLLFRGSGTGRVSGTALVSTGWADQSALVTPGNWNRSAGNDLLTRSAAGSLSWHPGDNRGGFGAPRAAGRGWQGMTYIG